MERLVRASTPVRVETGEKVLKKGRVQEADKEIVRHALNFEERKEEAELDEQEECIEKINVVHDSIPGLSKSHDKSLRGSLSKDRESCVII
jgi:hypothetical protein